MVKKEAYRMFPTNIHSKRGTSVRSPIVAGIIVGIVTINVVLLIAWCMFKRHRLRTRRERFAVREDVGRSSSTSSSTLSPKRTLTQKRVPDNQGTPPNYLQVMMSLQTVTPRPNIQGTHQYSRRSNFHGSSSKRLGVHPGAPNTKEIARSSRLANRDHYAPSLLSPPPSVRRNTSLRRRNSTDSASIYSSASAPLDYHDCVFPNFALHDAQSPTPPWASSLSAHVGEPPKLSRPTAPELSPEFYMKGRAAGPSYPRAGFRFHLPTAPSYNPPIPPQLEKMFPPAFHTPAVPSDIPPVPSLADYIKLPACPTVAKLRNDPSLKTSHTRHSFPIEESSRSGLALLYLPPPPTQINPQALRDATSTVVPPELPTRSPLRRNAG